MTYYFLENPFLTLVLGGFTLAILAGGWVQTQRRELIVAFIAALALVVGLVTLEWLVVTDRERLEVKENEVKSTIHQIAREAEANDGESLARHFHSSASAMRERLLSEITHFQVSDVAVKNNLNVVIDTSREPLRATATFNVVVTVSDDQGFLKDKPIPRFVTAYFEREDGQWRCTRYEHDDVRASGKQRQEER
jgi:hypothetical protein